MLCWEARVASWNGAGRPFQSWTVTTNPLEMLCWKARVAGWNMAARELDSRTCIIYVFRSVYVQYTHKIAVCEKMRSGGRGLPLPLISGGGNHSSSRIQRRKDFALSENRRKMDYGDHCKVVTETLFLPICKSPVLAFLC